MKSLANKAFKMLKPLREGLIVCWLWFPLFRFSLGLRRTLPLVVSLTSYPARIERAWISVESLMRQTVRPERLLLVLAEEEFPKRKLPRKIREQSQRGLQIHWVGVNGGSFDKLLPARQEFGSLPIITCDDDKYFPRNLIESLFEASLAHPDTVVGARGWIVRRQNGHLAYGAGWTRAPAGSMGRDMLMPGGNGCLYPVDSLDDEVNNLNLALEIAPTADDIWFWGALSKSKTNMLCLGLPPHRPVSSQRGAPALSDINEHANDRQFQAVMQHFRLKSIEVSREGPGQSDTA